MMSIQVSYKNTITRWERATRAMFRANQKYGQTLVDVLNNLTDREIAVFNDPLEATVFFLLLEMGKDKEQSAL